MLMRQGDKVFSTSLIGSSSEHLIWFELPMYA